MPATRWFDADGNEILPPIGLTIDPGCWAGCVPTRFKVVISGFTAIVTPKYDNLAEEVSEE